jgi:uncharacterized protein with PQ loop repeat
MTNHSHNHTRSKNKTSKNSSWKRFLNKAIYVVGLSSPIMTLPQLYNIWIDQNATGVSSVTWGWYIIVSTFWIFYGIAHKEKPIIVISIAWVVVEALVVIGTLLYT